MKKIGVVTGSRAEYGILKPVIDEILDSEKLELVLFVTGTHLSSEFGMTISEIEKDAVPIHHRVDVLDMGHSVETILSQSLRKFTEAFQRNDLDLVVVLGDRFEILGVAQACLFSRVPLAHIHGGEVTEGAFDDSIRHAITKMAHLHFCSNDQHRKRIIQLGESPERVFPFGAPGLDNIRKMKMMSLAEVNKSLNVEISKIFAMVTFHPVTLDQKYGLLGLEELFKALEKIEIDLVFTLPNIDPATKS